MAMIAKSVGAASTSEIDFSGCEIEPLTEMTVEALQNLAHACEKTADWKDRVRRMLAALKPKVGHGNWQAYCREHFAHLGSVRTLQLYMKPESSKDELKAICDQSELSAKSANVAHLKTGQVNVIDPRAEKDEDPNPAPRSNTKHSDDTRPKREDEKPRTAAVAVKAEIVDPEETDSDDDADRREAALGQLEEIVEILGLTTVLRVAVSLESAPEEKQERAALLRKVADTLDPDGAVPVSPKKAERPGSTPAASELVKMIPKDWPKILQAAAQDWCEHKQSLTRRERIQSTKAWGIALKQMAEQPADRVARKINKAIANNWKGWDHEGKSEVSQKSAAFYRNPGPKKPVRFDNVDYGDEG